MNNPESAPDFQVEALSEQHQRASFCCGVAPLDEYFTGTIVLQDVSRKLTNAFVLTPDGSFIAGFFTLSPLSILSVDLPERLAKRLPRRPIGVTLLGRMAVDQTMRGQGLGERLLMEALHRAWKAAKIVSSWAVVVDAKQGARDFYLKYEFTPFVSNPDRLFLPMKKIDLLFETR